MKTAAALVALLLTIALPASAQLPPNPDAKELRAYTLTMTALNQFIAASRNMMEAAKQDPRMSRMMALEKELDTLREKEEPSEADLDRQEKLEAEIEAMEDAMPDFNLAEAKDLDEMEKMIRSQPMMLNAITKAGMTPRDFSKFTLTFFQASMLGGMMKAGLIKELPKEVNPDNLAFLKEHEAEITRLTNELQALTKPKQ